MGEAMELEIGGRTVRVTNPSKVYFPDTGFTKLDVARYFEAVAPGALRAVRDRPTTLQRFVDGIGGEAFYQKRVPRDLPDWIPSARVSFPSGRPADEMCPTEEAAVLWAVNRGTLTFHPWPVRSADTDHPDELRIDLDPQPGTDFTDAAHAALELRKVLTELGLTGWPKTSGGRGLHVFVPIEPRWDFIQVRHAVIAIGRELERRMPDRVTTAWWKEERGERIFVDFNQTARDRTIAAAYSIRPFPHAPVSAPLHWDEVPEVRPQQFDITTMPARFAELGDVHAEMDAEQHDISAALALYQQDLDERGLGDMPYPPEYPKMPGEPKRVQPSRARHETDEAGAAHPE
ncbi:DNA ligase D [Streptacidiphilus sp. MAP12-33]|uniref:non-homologous end-joining DNA ligase n=1 Tax=Streptacidiphilus sp. MAP12-33 TaxID=3156266 RepID=UPI00351850A2